MSSAAAAAAAAVVAVAPPVQAKFPAAAGADAAAGVVVKCFDLAVAGLSFFLVDLPKTG